MDELKIREMLKPEYVFVDAVPEDGGWMGALKFISRFLAQKSGLNAEILLKEFLAREAIQSTGCGNGIALPHVCFQEDFPPLIAVVSFHTDIEWNAADKDLVKAVITFVMPKNARQVYLETLAAFSRRLAYEEFCSRLKRIPDAQALYQYIIQEVCK